MFIEYIFSVILIRCIRIMKESNLSMISGTLMMIHDFLYIFLLEDLKNSISI